MAFLPGGLGRLDERRVANRREKENFIKASSTKEKLMALLRGLSLRQLRAYAAVLRHGSITAAAEALRLTPPAISSQLKLLEEMVGAAVLQRGPSGFAASEIGGELLTLAEQVDSLTRRAEDRIDALKRGNVGSVTLGVVSTGKYFAPKAVAAFQKARPQIQVKLVIGNRADIIAGLERDDFDLLIMGRPPTHVDVDCEVLGDHPHVLIAKPDHPLAGLPEVQPEELAGETFLAREDGSGTRMLMSRFLDRIGDGRSFTVIEMGTNETIKQAVMAGLGIAIISAHTCFVELAEGKLAHIYMEGLPLVRQWYLMHRSDSPLTPAAQEFRAFMLEHRDSLLRMDV
jgi:DNA-binding transcriptional LysR family regulator